MKPLDPRSLPLLAADEVARNIAEGRQTQHRQPMRPQPTLDAGGGLRYPSKPADPFDWSSPSRKARHYATEQHWRNKAVVGHAPWQVGDTLYVRECHRQIAYSGRELDTDKPIHEATVEYRAGGSCIFRLDRRMDKSRGVTTDGVLRWTPSLNMSKEFARTRTKPLMRVWTERVQEMSEVDAGAMGMEMVDDPFQEGGKYWACHDPACLKDGGCAGVLSARASFETWWKAKHPGSWERNDWLWCCAWDGVEVRT